MLLCDKKNNTFLDEPTAPRFEHRFVNDSVKPCVSVVVPIYMTENYLRECLNSIAMQSYTDWECILVDDGCSDTCPSICDEFALKDSRFRVIHQPNQGVTVARANGIKVAKGEFVMFVDSDDSLHRDAISVLMQNIDSNIDVIMSLPSLSEGTTKVVNIKDLLLYCIKVKPFYVSPFAKLYRRSLFSDFVFDISSNLKNGEDCIMNIRLLLNGEGKCKLLGAQIYNYRIREGSATATFKLNLQYVKVFQTELKKSFLRNTHFIDFLPYIKETVARLCVALIRINKYNLFTLLKVLIFCLKYCPLEVCVCFLSTTNCFPLSLFRLFQTR